MIFHDCFNFLFLLQYVRALYDFSPQEPGELEFTRGEIITGQSGSFVFAK
jgi:hypothetical protein